MNVVLVGPEIEENLSIRYLAASLQHAGHRCRIADFRSSRDIPAVVRRISRKGTDLVGLSLINQVRCAEYFELVEELRTRDYRGHITAGGHFASLRAEEILNDAPGIDTILHHEGEQRIVTLADLLAGSRELPGSLDGITWRDLNGHLNHRPALRAARLDDLPNPVRRRPDRTLGFARAPLVSSRGCSGDCSFCSIRAWHGQVSGARLRLRSPELVAEEMALLYRSAGVRVFIFHDDDFIHPNPSRALDRCHRILDDAEERIGESFAFVIKCRPDDVNEELFTYLRSKGLIRAYVGIESHTDQGLQTLNRKCTQEINERALAILDELGVYACFNLLIFDPDTTIDTLDENLAFLKKHFQRPFDIGRTEIYASTPLEKRLIAEGRALGDYRACDYRIGDPDVEAVFRLFADALRDRHFGDRSIVNGTQDLGYRLSLLRRFHPGVITTEIKDRVAALICEVNQDTINFIESFRRFVEMRRSTPSSSERREFIKNVRTEAAQRIHDQQRRLTAISFELRFRAHLARVGLAGLVNHSTLPRPLRRAALALPYTAFAIGTLLSTESCITVCDPPPPPVQFSKDIEPILDQTCAVAGCHDVGTASADLVLESGQSYSNLVNVASTQVPELDRVEPAKPDSSYIIYKLEGSQSAVGGSGEQMPRNGQPGYYFNNLIRRWINEGADDNISD